MILGTYLAMRHAFAPGAAPDVTGYPTWPSAPHALAITGNVRPLTSLPLGLTVNGGELDPGGVEQFDWYVSQRTDDPSRQFLRLTPLSGRSGTMVVTATDYGAAELGLAPGGIGQITLPQVLRLFRHVDVYVRRRADGATGYLSILDAALSEV